MTNERHFQRVAELFESARKLPSDERDSFLREQCADAPNVLDEVVRLLGHHDDNVGALTDTVIESGTIERLAIKAAQELDRLPERIGRYIVRHKIGSGGMGAVYLAEQENPRREVAVKVIRPGSLSRELLKRFELEASMLGRLQHPGIAQIFEAGMFDDGSGGQPYFAMELIHGPPLLEYIQLHQLDSRAQLKLFACICDAVHHAHLRGVIHRDLKPGNILVDDSGQPKILDFGVARATDSDLRVTTIQTDAAQLIGTLPYMSPEQVVGKPGEIDVRSDVYALGVMLYEMLAGRLPYNLHEVTLISAAKMIAEDDPAPISTLNRTYRGDLNTIVLKALQKEPERRYGSASDLAADIRRYLNDEPITARPVTTMYQLRKFARRNRGLVAGVIVAFLAVTAGAIAATIGMINARSEADRAQSINDFMTDILVSADLSAGGSDVKLLDALRGAAGTVEARFADHPDNQYRVHTLLADAFIQLGAYPEARLHTKQVYEHQRFLYGPTDLRTIHAAAVYLRVLGHVGHVQAVDDIGNELLSHLNDELRNSREGLQLRRQIINGIDVRRPDLTAQTQAKMTDMLDAARSRFGDNDVLTRHIANDLAVMIIGDVIRGQSNDPQGDVQRGIDLLRFRLQEPDPLADDPIEDARARLNLADAVVRIGELEEAKSLVNDVIERHGVALGEDHVMRARASRTLADVHWALGEWRSAAEQLTVRIGIDRRRDGDGSIFALSGMSDGLPVLEFGGMLDKVGEYSTILLERLGGAHGDRSFEHKLYLARSLSAQGEAERAEELFREVRESGLLDSNRYLNCTYNLLLGEHHLSGDRRAEARQCFEEARRLRAQLSENSHPVPERIDDSFARLDQS